MSRKPIVNLAASVHRRLLNEARSSGRPFNELLQHYAMGRFLARQSRSAHAGRFVLKGGLYKEVPREHAMVHVADQAANVALDK